MRKKGKNKPKKSVYKTKRPKFDIYPNPDFLLPGSISWVGIDVSGQKNMNHNYFTQAKIRKRKKVKSDD